MNTKCSLISNYIIGDKKGCLPINDYEYVRDLYNKIEKPNKCNNENDLCLVEKIIENNKSNEIINQIYSLYYKPVTPNEWSECEKRFCDKKWLTNKDINNIMTHYMNLYENFYFMGIFYIDYIYFGAKNIDGDFHPLHKLNFNSLNKHNKNFCAMILNTASFQKPGEHWIALIFFWEGNLGEINYFDSYGNSKISPLPDEIMMYMKLIQKQGKKFGINFTCQKSKICHQKHNGECGVYCLYFIIYSLNNSFDSINKRIPDVNISNYRNILWRKGNDE